MTAGSTQRLIASVVGTAQRQHGVVLGSQLRAAGISREVVASLRRRGWLVPVRTGAYLVGATTPSTWQQVVAVGLLAGEGSALSHYTAARLHRLPGVAPSDIIHLTVAPSRHPRLSGVAVHRVAQLSPLDRQDYRGLSVTTPARTLMDIAQDLSPAQLARCLDEGLVARSFALPSVEAAAERSANRAGVVSLRTVLGQRTSPVGETALETRVIRALQCFGPFEVQHQVTVGGRVYLLDIAWPGPKVAVESDGWSVRSRSRSKLDHDRRRGNILAAHGWTVVHVTSAMSDDEMRAAVFRVLIGAVSRS